MPEPRCQHGLVICSRCIIVTDAARRMSDQINGRLTFYNPWDIRNKYMAFRLTDGWSNGDVYDTKLDAVKHNDEKLFAFFCFRAAMGGVKPKDCQLFLNMNRHAAEHGGHLADPDQANGGPQPIVRTEVYDRFSNRSRLVRPGWPMSR